MTLTITLQPIADDRAEARVGEQVVGTFDPRALLAEHPLHDARYVAPDTYGLRLLAALGGPALQERMIQLPRAPHPESAVIFQVSAPELAAIPWEYLHNGTTFVAFEHFLLREVPVPPGMLPPPPDSARPWRLVMMASDPLLQEVRDEKGFLKGYVPLPRLRVASELDTLRDSMRAQEPPPPLRWQRIAPARDALITLASPEPILFHYTGHGSVRDGQPILCFDDGAGTMKPQPVGDLAVDLRGRTYFAFLNACRTADSAEPAANLALTLVQNGVPAVLGTQASIRDDGAALFAETFYQQLIAGMPMEEALWRARIRLHNSFASDLTLWGIPAFYRAVGYRLPRQGYVGPPPPAIEPPAPLTSSLQAPARLLGRTTELTEIMRLFVFQHRQIVTIRGPGGMGKTALVHELASRLRFHFRDGIIAVTLALSGEQVSLSAAGLRADLARRMGLQHPAFDDPAASNAQEEAIMAAVQGRRALLIFDNYETVLGALGRDQEKDARLSEPEDVARRAEADAVQRLVTRLARAGVALLFTTRQAPVDLPEEYCYPEAAQGEQLTGLDNVSAIALFRQRAGSRKHSEALPGQVSHAVAGSPLAIQLAAARWGNGNQTEAEFLSNLDAELLKAEQSGVPFHQRSVQVNVGLSIDALSAELRQALYEISVVANPVITPLHAAVVWGLEDEKQWFSDQAHTRLEYLQDRSLLQGVGERDTERNWPQAYVFQPVIAQVVRSRAEASDLSAARERYGVWAAGRINLARGDKGISYDPEVARSTQFYIPDLIAALPYRPEERRGWDAWQLATILRQFGRVVEATHAIDLAAQMAQKTEDRKLSQRYLVEAAAQAVQRGDLSQALDHYQAALPLMEGEDDRQERSATLHNMARVLVTRGDLAGAMGLYEQSLAIDESLGDIKGKSATLHAMAGVRVTRGDLAGAMGLYEQSLRIQESLGDIKGKSATLHQMAGVLVTRGDLAGAMGLYEQSLRIQESLGDIQGKATTLLNLAQLQVMRGDRERAIRAASEGVAIFEHLGAPRELAQAREILAAIESWSGNTEDPERTTPAGLAGRLVAFTTAALQGREPTEKVHAALNEVAAATPVLAAYTAALGAALERVPGAAAQLLAAACTALADDNDQWAYGDTLAGVGNVAALLDDTDSEIAAREESIAAFRRAPQDAETRDSLRSAIRNLSVFHYNHDNYAAALPLMEEALALLPAGEDDPDLRRVLEIIRRLASGAPPPGLCDAIIAWRDGERDGGGLAALLNATCNTVVGIIREGDGDAREALAADLALLRAVRPLPIPATNEFLHLLQLWLRDEPGMAARATQLRAGLPDMFIGALENMERSLAGTPDEDEDVPEDEEANAMAGHLATMLEVVPPAQRPILTSVITQILPFIQATAAALSNPQVGPQERAEFATQLEDVANQAAAGEASGSPWLDAAAALRTLATRLRGGAVDLETLAEPFRSLVGPLL